MKYKALISFCGKVSMTMGEVRVISDQSIVKDLLKAGYIEEVKPEKKVEPVKKAEPEKKAQLKKKTQTKKKTPSKK